MVEAKTKPDKTASRAASGAPAPTGEKKGEKKPVKEIGGPKGPEPTRYGDWERKGRCIDF